MGKVGCKTPWHHEARLNAFIRTHTHTYLLPRNNRKHKQKYTTYTHTRKQTGICTQTCIRTHTCMHAHIHARTHTPKDRVGLTSVVGCKTQWHQEVAEGRSSEQACWSTPFRGTRKTQIKLYLHQAFTINN